MGLPMAFAWAWMMGTINVYKTSNFNKLKFVKVSRTNL
jgi:hypothetical protein